ncbi:hypothetical protein QL093DRAFT_2552418 [Fusarium oxysporum]|nr:hypothetical protein QL093DRAFT_2552418 [Fusarium oxysporum]
MQVREREVVAGYERTECSHGWLGWGRVGMIQQPRLNRAGFARGSANSIFMSGYRSLTAMQGAWQPFEYRLSKSKVGRMWLEL